MKKSDPKNLTYTYAPRGNQWAVLKWTFLPNGSSGEVLRYFRDKDDAQAWASHLNEVEPLFPTSFRHL